MSMSSVLWRAPPKYIGRWKSTPPWPWYRVLTCTYMPATSLLGPRKFLYPLANCRFLRYHVELLRSDVSDVGSRWRTCGGWCCCPWSFWTRIQCQWSCLNQRRLSRSFRRRALPRSSTCNDNSISTRTGTGSPQPGCGLRNGISIQWYGSMC